MGDPRPRALTEIVADDTIRFSTGWLAPRHSCRITVIESESERGTLDLPKPLGLSPRQSLKHYRAPVIQINSPSKMDKFTECAAKVTKVVKKTLNGFKDAVTGLPERCSSLSKGFSKVQKKKKGKKPSKKKYAPIPESDSMPKP